MYTAKMYNNGYVCHNVFNLILFLCSVSRFIREPEQVTVRKTSPTQPLLYVGQRDGKLWEGKLYCVSYACTAFVGARNVCVGVCS